MRRPTISKATLFLVAGLMPIGSSQAQDAPAAKPAPAPSSTAKSAQTPAAKPGQGTTARKPGPAPLVLKTPKDKASYAIGMNVGKSLHKDSVDVDPTILLRGLKDALAGGKTLLTDDEAKTAMVAIQADLRKKQEAKMAVLGDANKKEGDAFLADNKTKEGVVTLPSGLQYKILKEGTGPKPSATDSVVCNYKGTLIDNTEFDSSYKRGQPATFPVGQVIKGWTEVLQLMPVGSKWQVWVPSELGYGPRGPGGPIGPNATLIFEIELLSIQGK
jgi:FKBP-type peptidyl-prolyl cis-trans isomerase FklB